MENRNIIIVGQQAWDTEIGSNCKNIALEFSKKNKVLYVNPPLDRISKYRGKTDDKVQKRLNVINGTEPGLIEVNPNLFNLYPDCLIESINWIPNDFFFDAINKYNNNIFSKFIRQAANSLGFTDYILFNDNDIFRSFYLKDLLKPVISVYYSRDNMVATEYWKRHGLVLEPKLIAKSDLCVANSEYLKNYCKGINPNSFYVGQGCDIIEVDQNDKATVAEVRKGFESIPYPIIGYVGFLTAARLDISLLKYMAVNQPSWNIVLVGPEDELFKKSDLHNLPNIHFLGSKETYNLPKYISLFDVCINPQILNDLTIGNYPRKIDEYLMLGKPTVATKTESMEVFKDHVSLANNEVEFVNCIETLLNHPNESLIQSRIAFASSHTWENSVQLIYDRISDVLLQKGISQPVSAY